MPNLLLYGKKSIPCVKDSVLEHVIGVVNDGEHEESDASQIQVYIEIDSCGSPSQLLQA